MNGLVPALTAQTVDAIAPLVACVMCFGIPIVAILVKHQQKMALIVRDQSNTVHSPEMASVRQDLNDLKNAVHQLTIQIDDLAALHRSSPPAMPTDVRDRLQA